MPAGDPQRTWFPEMLEILRARWHVGLPFAKLIELSDELDTMLHRIRAERHIRPPVTRLYTRLAILSWQTPIP